MFQVKCIGEYSKNTLINFQLSSIFFNQLFKIYICDALRDFGSVTIWPLHGRSNACECMLTLFSTVVFIRLHELA